MPSPPAVRLLASLKHDFPEWQPWLAVVEAVVQESDEAKWQAYVPTRPPAHSAVTPLLTGATIITEENEIARWIDGLLHLAPVAKGDLRQHALGLLQASICQNQRQIEQLAVAQGAQAGAFRSLIDLIALPFLHACQRRWSSLVPEGWSQGYCPICGAWPAFAEELGIARTRRLRCGRCGADWHADILRCPYCATSEHRQLSALVPVSGSDARRIDGCEHCHGYLKTLVVLQGSAPQTVLLDDLASVDLDIAALNADYVRPDNPGYDPDIRVSASAAHEAARGV